MAKVLERERLGTTEAAPEEGARHRTPTRRGLIVAALAVLAVAVAVTGYLLSRGSEETAAIAVDFEIESSYVPDPSQELTRQVEGSTRPISSYIPADPSREIELALTEASRKSSYVPQANEIQRALTEPTVGSARPASSYVPQADEIERALTEPTVGSARPASSYVPQADEIERALTEPRVGSARPASSYVPPADEIERALTEPRVGSARPASSYVPPADELGMALSQESVAAPADHLHFR